MWFGLNCFVPVRVRGKRAVFRAAEMAAVLTAKSEPAEAPERKRRRRRPQR